MPGKKKKSTKGRTLGSYRRAARELAKLVPSVAKYRTGKGLTPHQKGAITKAEKKTRHRNLIPVTAAQAKKIKSKYLAGNGIRAIATDGFGDGTKFKIRNGAPVLVGISGREATPISLPTPLTMMDEEGEDDDEVRDNLEIWFIAIAEVHAENPGADITWWLWTARGRTSESYSRRALETLLLEIAQGSRYSFTEDWLRGLYFVAD